jgi:hypothetical protein
MISFKNIELKRVLEQESSKTKYLFDNKKLYVEEAVISYYKTNGIDAIWSENGFWWTLVALLFWDIVFAKIPSAISTGNDDSENVEPWDDKFDILFEQTISMNGMPLDLYSPDFYNSREILIRDRITELGTENITSIIKISYNSNYNKNCRLIEDWNKFSIEDLQKAVEYLGNIKVLKICERLLLNLKDNRSGLPDLLLYNSKKIVFCEVKSEKDRISKKQKEWHVFLSEINEIDVEIITVNQTERQLDNLKKAYSKEECDKIINSILEKKEKPIKIKYPSYIKNKKVVCSKCGGNIDPSSVNCWKCYAKNPLQSRVDTFYNYNNLSNECKKDKKYLEMLIHAKKGISKSDIVFIYDEIAFNEKFDGITGPHISLINDFCYYCAAYGFFRELQWIKNYIERRPHMAYNREIIEDAFRMYDIAGKLKYHLNENDYVIQKDIKKLLSIKDGRIISRVVGYLEKIGAIEREKIEKTYKIFLNKNFNSSIKLDDVELPSKNKKGTANTGCATLAVLIFIIVLLSIIT